MEAYMQSVKNERGSVLIFATLIIVLLLIMVGMGLDTGHLAYVRSQGQPAVDSAALAAASAIPSGDMTKVTEQAAKFNPGASGNPGAGNNYVSSSNPNNKIASDNVTLVHYDKATGAITTSGVTVDPSAPANVRANGVRVALENNNPYGGTAGAAMQSPLFLTPLFNLFGQTTSNTADVSTSAVAVLRALPGLPIVITDSLCGKEEAILDLQNGNTAGWETYYIENTSTTWVRDLWEALPFCSGQPIVDIGYCGNIANGVNATIFNAHLKPMFKAEPTRCYLIPVVKHNGNFNQCQTITDWAQFCPACGSSVDCANAFPGQGQLKGKITCGQDTWTSRDTKCYVPFLVRDTKSGM
jgi:Flp pilus assembly protein TadG